MSLTIEKLNVKLQSDEILHEVNLDIQDGEFVSLLGASGCGKSTLLKSIAGLLDIRSGSITINGEDISRVPPEKRGTVIVFQDLRLFPHMTVEKNIAFPMELKKVPKDIRHEAVIQLLKEVQLSGYEHRKIREMSGGQLQRVALARALAAGPRVLLLDEPFSGLDERLRTEMGALVKKLHEEKGLTTILVTHDKEEALQMSDRIALMSEGDILQYDTPRNIFHRPVSKKVADYFGTANYIAGEVKDGQFISNICKMKAELPNGRYVAMIRPFALRPDGKGEECVIREIIFMGETVQLSLMAGEDEYRSALPGGDLERMGLAKGDVTGISVDESQVCFFREE